MTPTGSVSECNITNSGWYAFFASSCTNSGITIAAENNWWGTDNLFTIEGMVYHQIDASSSPLVDYDPCAAEPFSIDTPTDVRETPGGTGQPIFVLRQNYPNPFNAATVIEFDLPAPGRARIEIFNIMGQSVTALADRWFPAGRSRLIWDGTDADNRPAASGVYLYKIAAEDVSAAKKMILLK
ncbi:MAG TPA: T9SS type A sorting domain-containing protein [Acidobacteriota bacterium]|nr:T9SS type A sorting domain-containing protein [Acidobacteriota bacterium]